MLEANVSAIRQSQEESNATTKYEYECQCSDYFISRVTIRRLLDGIRIISDTVDLGDDNTETFIHSRFSLHIEEQLIDEFNGVTFTAIVGPEITTLTTSIIKDGSLESSASLKIPPSLFEQISVQVASESARFAYAVYNDDVLYQRPQENFENFTIGSVIMAASLTEITVANLSTPITISFTKYEVRDPLCRLYAIYV